MRVNHPEVTIPEDLWDESGEEEDPTARLITTLTINGLLMHLEAIAVQVNEDDVQEGVTEEMEEIIDQVYNGVGGDGPWMTTTIRGREYVLIATPFCE